MDMKELALFAEPPRVAIKQASLAQIQRDLQPRWSHYNGKHQPCAICVRDLHKAHGIGPMPRTARLLRTIKATGERTLLCEPCAAPIRGADWQASPAGQRAKEASKAGRR